MVDAWPADKITKRKTDELIPYARNARTHSDEQVAQIAASIKEWGWTTPILVDEDSEIIAGHGRVLAARKLDIQKVPTIMAKGWTKAQKQAYVLADNQLPQNAGWDMDLLKVEVMDLDTEGFDLTLMGFDDDMMAGLLNEETEGLTDEDAVPELTEDPITKLGDIWTLGNHRLMCGDSTSIDAVEELMPEPKANMIFTDPPYLMDFSGGIHADGSKSFNAKHGEIKNDKMSEEDGDQFLDDINTVIAAKVDGAFYITFYRLGIDRYYASMKRTGLVCRSLVVWDKGNHTLSNSDYMSMYEPMFYGWVNNHKFYGGKAGMDIWRIKRTAKNDLHPTMKPVELVEKAILDGSQVNGVILDLFGGAGPTVIAAEKNNRHARVMELDPKYCDVIIKRWQDFTGNDAMLDGKKYNDMI